MKWPWQPPSRHRCLSGMSGSSAFDRPAEAGSVAHPGPGSVTGAVGPAFFGVPAAKGNPMTVRLHSRILPVLLGPVLAIWIWAPPQARAGTAAGCIISGVGYDFSIAATSPDAQEFCDGLVKNPPHGMQMEHVENITPGDTEICSAHPTDVNQIQIWDNAEHVQGDGLCKEFSKHMKVYYAGGPESAPTDTPTVVPTSPNASSGPPSPKRVGSTGEEACVLSSAQGADFNIVATGKGAIQLCRDMARRKDFKSASQVAVGSSEVCHTVEGAPVVEVWGHPASSPDSGQYCMELAESGMTVVYTVPDRTQQIAAEDENSKQATEGEGYSYPTYRAGGPCALERSSSYNDPGCYHLWDHDPTKPRDRRDPTESTHKNTPAECRAEYRYYGEKFTDQHCGDPKHDEVQYTIHG